jgi:outer membrane protein TolC
MGRDLGDGGLAVARASLWVMIGASGLIAAPPDGPPPAPARPATTIPWPRPIRADDPASRRASGPPPARIGDPGRGAGTAAPPGAPAPIPPPIPGPAGGEGAAPPGPARATTAMALDAAKIPGRTIEPIDLVSALRLAGARDLDIAIARQRICRSLADLESARALWLPSLFIGPTWYRADGQVQAIDGTVMNVNRSSLFLGATSAMSNSFPAASPGTGYPQLNGLNTVIRISDAIYSPLAAQRVVAADRAGLKAATSDALLAVAEAYLDLQQASGRLAIAREAADNAEALSRIALSFARLGEGLEADHRRALAELKHQRQNIQGASGRLLVASTNLVRLLVLNPRVVVAPVEPAEAIVRLVPDDAPLDDLIIHGLQHRSELERSQELVRAAIVRLKQAKLRPWIPSVAFTYAGGGFGGGPRSFFGNFGARGDAMASVFWELQHLGLSDRAAVHRGAAEQRTAELELVQAEARVAAEVAASYDARAAASQQIAQSRETVAEALDSLRLNMVNVQQGAGLPRATRPIEVLQPIQALAQARLDYLDSVVSYNRAQFRLRRAIGRPLVEAPPCGP